MGETTFVLRRLPCDLTTRTLMSCMDWEGFRGEYDFCYVPVHFASGKSIGHAFVNILSTETARRFVAHFADFTAWHSQEDQERIQSCQVEPTCTQGLRANVERYRNSSVMHSMVPEALKPVLLSRGEVIPFPTPTRFIKRPKRRVGSTMAYHAVYNPCAI